MIGQKHYCGFVETLIENCSKRELNSTFSCILYHTKRRFGPQFHTGEFSLTNFWTILTCLGVKGEQGFSEVVRKLGQQFLNKRVNEKLNFTNFAYTRDYRNCQMRTRQGISFSFSTSLTPAWDGAWSRSGRLMEEIRYDIFNISMLSPACLRTCLFPSCRKWDFCVHAMLSAHV